MTPIDPKLLALAKSLRPDLAQRLIVMKATEAGRGLLIKPAGRPPMPALPPTPATPDPAAAKAAVLPRPAPGVAEGPQAVALSAYVDEGALARDIVQGTGPQAAGQPAEAERPPPGGVAGEVPARGVPFATAHLPPGRVAVADDGPPSKRGDGTGPRRPSARPGESDAVFGPVGRAGALVLAGLVLLAILAAAVV